MNNRQTTVGVDAVIWSVMKSSTSLKELLLPMRQKSATLDALQSPPQLPSLQQTSFLSFKNSSGDASLINLP